ncbi:MAG TPA: hypothetical protein VEQ58_13285, partial [Polyangiaceae bacterium]|nr:hypothetical protein [Polyangiaceae bacterium]
LRLTYAIAPPNRTTAPARRQEIAAEQSARLESLPIDALLVYDVQDEAARTDTPRPFAFVPKVDPLAYAFEALRLSHIPRIVYRTIAGQDEPSLCRWLEQLHAHGGRAVLVGAPSRDSATTLTLPQALALCQRHAPALPFGGVLIPERHQTRGGEDQRVLTKMRQGCGFFVSQTVWSVSATKLLLRDLCARAELTGQAPPPMLFTFSPCGSAQTLDFLEWLGVLVPPSVKRELLASKDMLSRSIDLATDAFAEIRAFAKEHGIGVGCNVESLTARAAEIDASVELLHRIDRLDARLLPRADAALRAAI